MSGAATPPPVPRQPGPPPVPGLSEPPPLDAGTLGRAPATQASGLSIQQAAALAGLPTARMSMGRLIMEGQIEGRLVKGMVHAVTRTRYAGDVRYRQRTGTRLTLETPSDSGGRMVIAYHISLGRVVRWLNRKGGLYPVEGEVPGGHLGVWSHEPQWSQRLLANPEILEDVLHLLPMETRLQTLAIQVYPDRIVYTCMGSEGQIVNMLAGWVETSVRLAGRLEAAPRPTNQHRPGWMERHPVMLAVLLLGAFFFFIIAGALLLVGLAFLIAG